MVHIDFTEARGISRKERIIEQYQITPRCLQILRSYAKGQTDKQTAMELGVGLTAVHNQKTRLRDRMSEPSNVSMIVRLVREGVI
jgi:DNA-binding NarL/FixJ family response regulator